MIQLLMIIKVKLYEKYECLKRSVKTGIPVDEINKRLVTAITEW